MNMQGQSLAGQTPRAMVALSWMSGDGGRQGVQTLVVAEKKMDSWNDPGAGDGEEEGCATNNLRAKNADDFKAHR